MRAAPYGGRRNERPTMAVTKDDVLAALAKVKAPDGSALPQTRALSDVVVTDGKVFFSISVDAGAVKAWEPIRKNAEDAVRAIPGVQSALVALTAERTGKGPAPSARATQPAHAHAHGNDRTQGIPGVEAIIAVASGKGGVGKS